MDKNTLLGIAKMAVYMFRLTRQSVYLVEARNAADHARRLVMRDNETTKVLFFKL